MDSNRGIPWDLGAGVMGGFFYGNPAHVGTYLKDIHMGLGWFLTARAAPQVLFWTTKTRGKGYAGVMSPTGGVAVIHTNATEAFAEVCREIDQGRTLILSYLHWNLISTPFQLSPQGTNTESAFGGSYYIWGPFSPGGNPEDEVWNGYTDGEGLGHAVTAVGYIPKGDPNDLWQQVGLTGPTDWVIVHDNWAGTVRNVIIPFDFAGHWVANTTAEPTFAPIDSDEPKWIQPRDPVNGTDILSCQPPDGWDPMNIVADDFLCDGRPITGIRWWGSYPGYEPDRPGPVPLPPNRPDGFEVRWYHDTPSGLLAPHSLPVFPPIRTEYHPISSCRETYVGTVFHGWEGTYEHEFVYVIRLENPWNEKKGHTYWISISAVYSNPPESNFWGWATALPESGWNDAAVRRDLFAPVGWTPLNYSSYVPPYGSNPVHMAFELLTDVTNRRATKWLQPPDMSFGENMASWRSPDPWSEWTLRADDFLCDGRRITDIHWWGSYLGWATNHPGPIDERVMHPSPYDTPIGFLLSWHADIPAGSPGPNGPLEFSMPGELLTNLFVPFSRCHEVYYGTVTQEWKGAEVYDHEFQYYVDLLDTNIPAVAPWAEEQGMVYWLNIQAIFTNGWEPGQEHQGWGWKNTPPEDGWNDASVIASRETPQWLPALFPPENPNHMKTPFCNLAFELTTDEPGTNRWSGDLQITQIRISAPTVTRISSVGDGGAGRQYLQINTNISATNAWATIATNVLPLPPPYTNQWTFSATNRLLFYRILQQ